jgi:hypothetical protein
MRHRIKGDFHETRCRSQVAPLTSSRFLVGRNSRGHWLVQDRYGLCGGIFFDRAVALRFALTENGDRPDAVSIVPDTFELHFDAEPP